VTGDERCVHYFQPETKWAGKGLLNDSSTKSETFCTQVSTGKVMLSIFRDHQDPLVGNDNVQRD
jgi:hypothetical protein